ncbi:MAG TPA: LysR family transcriptional regulator [Burkholderiaceae bacterium]
MLNPQLLGIFSAIVQHGSISRAAEQLDIGKSVVSRQLAKLEEELGARLIQRSTRRLALTEIGEMVLQEARRIEQSLTNIEQLTDQYQAQVRGVLRISCSAAGRFLVVPAVTGFVQQYPQVKVDLQFEDRLVDLIAEQVDLAIRASALEDSSLIARKLFDNERVLVASPAYLKRAGTPQTPQDLSAHACLIYTNGGKVFDEWTFLDDEGPYKVRVSGPIQINDGGALVTAAVCGAGIQMIPQRIVRGELARGELVQVLPDARLPISAPVYAVYPARDFLPLKISAFIEFLQKNLAD